MTADTRAPDDGVRLADNGDTRVLDRVPLAAAREALGAVRHFVQALFAPGALALATAVGESGEYLLLLLLLLLLHHHHQDHHQQSTLVVHGVDPDRFNKAFFENVHRSTKTPQPPPATNMCQSLQLVRRASGVIIVAT